MGDFEGSFDGGDAFPDPALPKGEVIYPREIDEKRLKKYCLNAPIMQSVVLFISLAVLWYFPFNRITSIVLSAFMVAVVLPLNLVRIDQISKGRLELYEGRIYAREFQTRR